MFISRPDVVDQFASNFRSTAEGEILFQPGNAEVGLPITSEEYESVILAFEQRQKVNMALTWIAMFAALGYGGYKLLAEGTYKPFLIAAGLAFLWSFLLNLRGGLGLLLPFIQRREELLKAIELQAQTAENRPT